MNCKLHILFSSPWDSMPTSTPSPTRFFFLTPKNPVPCRNSVDFQRCFKAWIICAPAPRRRKLPWWPSGTLHVHGGTKWKLLMPCRWYEWLGTETDWMKFPKRWGGLNGGGGEGLKRKVFENGCLFLRENTTERGERRWREGILGMDDPF